MQSIEELTKEELLDLIKAYEYYIEKFRTEDYDNEDFVCLAEFYDNEYQIILAEGNK